MCVGNPWDVVGMHLFPPGDQSDPPAQSLYGVMLPYRKGEKRDRPWESSYRDDQCAVQTQYHNSPVGTIWAPAEPMTAPFSASGSTLLYAQPRPPLSPRPPTQRPLIYSPQPLRPQPKRPRYSASPVYPSYSASPSTVRTPTPAASASSSSPKLMPHSPYFATSGAAGRMAPAAFSTPSPVPALTAIATNAAQPSPVPQLTPASSVWDLAQYEPRRTPLARSTQPVHWLLRLPPGVWDRIRRYLPYGDVHNLVFAGRQFAAVNVVRFVPWRERKARMVPLDQALPSQNRLACYLCYGFRPIDAFQITGELVGNRVPQHTFARVDRKNPYTGARTFTPERSPAPPVPQRRPPPPPPPNHGEWVPRPPGAEVGEIETLGRYCIACALKSGLAEPGDVIYRVAIRDKTPGRKGAAGGVEALEKRWVCHCYQHHGEGAGGCPRCYMTEVYTNPV